MAGLVSTYLKIVCLIQDSLDSEVKRHTSLGVGASVKEAQAFSIEQHDKLWNLNLLGNKSAKVRLDEANKNIEI